MLMANQIKVLSMHIREMGSYQSQYRRPFMTTLNGETAMLFMEGCGELGSGISPALMAPIAGNIMHSATTGQEAPIPGGWHAKRLSFTMELEYRYTVGSLVRVLVQGYTDPVASVVGKDPADDLMFYVNAVYLHRTSSERTLLGQEDFEHLISASQVFQQTDPALMLGKDAPVLMRPSDIFEAITRAHFQDFAGEKIFDARSSLFSGAAYLSAVHHAIPSHYLARFFTAYLNAAKNECFATDHNETMYQARGYVQDQPISTVPFFRHMSNATGRPACARYTWAELKQAFPELLDATVVTKADKQRTAKASDSVPMYEADYGVVTADRIHGLVVALMRQHGLFKAVLSTTNQVVDNVPVITVKEIDGLWKTDKVDTAKRHFEQELQHELKHYITMGNIMHMALDMDVNVNGETWMVLSLDASPSIGYVFPSFADATYSPLIAPSIEHQNTVAGDLSWMLDQLTATVVK